MSTGSSAPPATRPRPFGRERWGLPRLRDARIRSKLALILFVPLVAVLALATVRLVDVGGRALDAAQIEDLARLNTGVSDLTQVMHLERMAAGQFLADPDGRVARTAVPTPGPEPKAAYTAAIAATDSRIQRYNDGRRLLDKPPAAVEQRLDRIDDHLRTMDAIRARITENQEIAVSEAMLRYGVVITDLVGYGDVLGQYARSGEVADGLRAVSAFTRAKAGTAEQEAVSYAAVVSGDVSAEQQAAFVATQTSQQEALLAFSLVATPAQRALVDSTVTGDAVNLADQVAIRLSRGETVAAADIVQSLGAVVDLMRWAEQRLESGGVRAAADESSSVTRQATVESILVLLVLVLAVALAVVLARSLNLSLRRLREGALAVANRDLPEAVARLRDIRNFSDGGADDIVREMRDPIQLRNRDEIGQVAQAFNVVHREAVRVAAEQAALRTSVSAMFLNLARRSQSLVDRMIGELDRIERSEEDPKRLARLFELDHLATRMRRNDENLLVLAGADSSAPRREDALLVDVLRAAQSEVELYNRIEFGTVDTDIAITALAVNDVVRLVAELLDNATRFSPPNTVVVADGRRIRDYVVIQVEDRGLGMSEHQMDQLNRRLAEPPGVDVAAFRLMGLAVVGRLASRYGIRVELRANLEGGTVAQVILPSQIVVLPNRPVDPPRSGRQPQLDNGRSGGWEALPAGRAGTATATLPAIAPEPWRAELPAPVPPMLPGPVHPALPQMPSQRPPAEPLSAPTVNRPPLPTRVAQPVAAAPTTPAAPAAPVTAVPAPAPAAAAIASPTVAYPTVQPSASPDLQVAVGFVTPDGRKIPPPPRPVSPDPSGWGAALASIPPPPPPPAPAPVEPRAEAPIFLQMQANWFKGHDGVNPEDWSMPTAGYAPPPSPLAQQMIEAAVPPAPTASPTSSAPPAAPTSLPATASSPVSATPPFAPSLPSAGSTRATPARPPSANPAESVRSTSDAPAGSTAVAPAGSTAVAPAGPVSSAPGGPTSATPARPTSAAPIRPTSAAPARPTSDTPAHAAPPAPESSGPARSGAAMPRSSGAARPTPSAPVPAAPVSAPASDPLSVPPAADRASMGAFGNGNGHNGSRPAQAGSDNGGPSVPRPRSSGDEHWRTAADEGWQRAMAAAEPPDAGTTRSGLPKRVPQAQLVPGGVQTGPRNSNRRSPDEVRGLLSAYHRGVQRGRTAGSEEAAAGAPAPKENEQ